MKEVVHVPTLELAKEVLKIAKEQGFKEHVTEVEYYFKVFGCKTCFRIEKNDFRAATKDFYENRGCKVITADKFLSRYKSTELEQLRKENAELKEKLKSIEDQPKVGDVCLFWDDNDFPGVHVYILHEIRRDGRYPYRMKDMGGFKNCLKATPENIEKVIEQIKLHNK